MPSLNPKSFAESPLGIDQQNGLIKEARYNVFDYIDKQGVSHGQGTAARFVVVADGGEEYVQQYSVGKPERYPVSADGKTLVTENSIPKSCNLAFLINGLVNAGFPENKLPDDGDISKFEGLYAYWIAQPEPKREGLEREAPADGTKARPKVLPIPSRILNLPWEKAQSPQAASKSAAGAGAAPKAGAAKGAAKKSAPDSAEVVAKAVKFVTEQVSAADEGVVSRQDIAVAAFAKFAKDPDKDAIVALIYKPAFQVELVKAGLALDGDNVSKAE